MANRLRKKQGSSIIETIIGIIVIVPIILFLVDVGAMVMCQTANDKLAKHSARAAAEKSTAIDAKAAADLVLAGFKPSQLCSNPTRVVFNFDQASGQVYVETEMTCNLPVPVPFSDNLSSQKFRATANEPIVGILPE